MGLVKVCAIPLEKEGTLERSGIIETFWGHHQAELKIGEKGDKLNKSTDKDQEF